MESYHAACGGTKVIGALIMIALVIWLPHSIAFGQTDHDDDASVGEWFVLAAFTAIGISFLVLLAIVWHRNTNPHTGLPARVKRRRARGPLRGGRLD
jgi:hypothetical protein